MKKLSVLLVAALVVLALAMPAAAFENEFGGYWRTRFYTDIGFSGSDIAAKNQDTNAVDTRTRLFYTAKFSENLKFVNKFEVNATWGGNGGYGQVGADNSGADTFRVKNSYVDFKLAEQRFTIGVQNFQLGRGYLLDDDASGIKAMFKVNDSIYLPLIFLKMYEGGYGKVAGNSASNYDLNAYVFYPTLYINKENTLKPHVAYMTSENGSLASAKNTNFFNDPSSATFLPGVTKVDLWTAGLEYDGKIGIFDLGATGIFQFGNVTVPAAMYNNHDQLDFTGNLFDIFGGVNLGPANIHAKGIYSSGNKRDEDPAKSGNLAGFVNPGKRDTWGASYYWAEIMGEGIIDNQAPIGAPDDKISNVYIANLGGSYKLLADLKFSADLWWANRAQDVAIATDLTRQSQRYSSTLGTELDLVATYTIVDNLKVDLIGAYLWAGDCITMAVDPKGSTNPIELAAQFSLAF
ncbi:MAG: hypothetical protein WCJ49_07895 [Deltaproteobacteria bacterium]